LDRVALIVNWGSGASEVINFIYFDMDRLNNIMMYVLEVGVVHKMGDILASTGIEVIQTDNFAVILEKAFTKVGTDEAGSSGNQNTLFVGGSHKILNIG
jgi:hypothetical protein